MKRVIEKILKNQIYQSADFEVDKLPLSIEVINACKLNHCGKYNTNWTCPPAVGTIDEIKNMLLKFERAFVFNKVYTLLDSFDIEGMDKARQNINALCDNIIEYLIKNQIRHKVLKAGSCDICRVCTYPENPCRHKERACYSLEGCGISVVDLAKQNGLNYYNGINTVTYFAMILY